MSEAEITESNIILRSDSYTIGYLSHSVILMRTCIGGPTGYNAKVYTLVTIQNNGYGDWTPLRIKSFRRQSAAKAAFKRERNRLSNVEIAQ